MNGSSLIVHASALGGRSLVLGLGLVVFYEDSLLSRKRLSFGIHTFAFIIIL
jgi:hypothetical protein